MDSDNVIGEHAAAVLLTDIAVAVEQTTRMLEEANELHTQLADLLGMLTDSLVKIEKRLSEVHGDGSQKEPR